MADIFPRDLIVLFPVARGDLLEGLGGASPVLGRQYGGGDQYRTIMMELQVVGLASPLLPPLSLPPICFLDSQCWLRSLIFIFLDDLQLYR